VVSFPLAFPQITSTHVKDSFYKELERVFDKFPKYHMKIVLGDFSAKIRKEDIFKQKQEL
jgi:hypothetical protein